MNGTLKMHEIFCLRKQESAFRNIASKSKQDFRNLSLYQLQ